MIDETGSRIKLKRYTPPTELKELETDIQRFSKEKNLYIKLHDLEKASSIRLEEERLKRLYEQLHKQWLDNLNKDIPYVNEEDIEYTVSKMTGIPLSKLEEKRSEKLIKYGRESSTGELLDKKRL